ncbi:hypothetical protein Leryth_003333 [Lithospermum erythrorhizon]|nr:hypothetical protein Leryth_003333 [Lithospermum erythrorhizon]
MFRGEKGESKYDFITNFAIELRAGVFQIQGWTSAMNARNILPEGFAGRPVLYAGKSASPWGHLMQQTGTPKDFLSELRQAMHNANCNA